ncbi:MAG: metalloregulator ArsR/SmtB family transcription factor [Anaerolineales bacterium]
MEANVGDVPIKINWDKGTGYDFFASLSVLHYPAKFGLRGAWAAGVRSRLSPEDREFFENLLGLFFEPYEWVYSLPEPKDVATVLYSLKQIPPAQRLSELILTPIYEKDLTGRLREVQERGSWREEDRDFLHSLVVKIEGKSGYTPKKVEKLLDLYAHAEEFGETYLGACQSYYEVFFAEEEKRIAPKLEAALENAQKLAGELPFLDLLEELSRGLKYDEFPGVKEMILIPTYWLSPLVTTTITSKGSLMMLFAGRPPGESLVPGEIVPEDLLQILKALADPTRLRILRYLMQEQLTPAELSRRLRLRAPTLTHHLHILRLAGLVRFAMRGKSEHLYFARMESIKSIYVILKEFLEQDVVEVEGVDFLDRDRVY